MENARLIVYIAGKRAGSVTQGRGGVLSFAYDVDYAGVPLSLSMPLSNRGFGDKIVRPYLFGLLPDSPDVRRSLGREFGVSGNNPFALLQHVGLDCPAQCRCASRDRRKGCSPAAAHWSRFLKPT
ncbi:HipA N-terminal domain-containing protein [Enorma burkinafasonensis]|uniref:HipA N-terminal domain-containing protein n=1 Tax=Enorma burkinafasonensis TaxID=2590867 RepID=UPI00350E52CA